MRPAHLICALSMLLLSSQCQNESNVPWSIIEEELNVKLPKDYVEIQSEKSAAIGDSYEFYYLKYESVGIKGLQSKIVTLSSYKDSVLRDINSVLAVNREKVSPKWYRNKNGFIYINNIGGFSEYITCEIDTLDNTIYYQYVTE